MQWLGERFFDRRVEGKTMKLVVSQHVTYDGADGLIFRVGFRLTVSPKEQALLVRCGLLNHTLSQPDVTVRRLIDEDVYQEAHDVRSIQKIENEIVATVDEVHSILVDSYNYRHRRVIDLPVYGPGEGDEVR